AALHEAGFARLDLGALGRDGVAVEALRRLVRLLAGRPFPPAGAAAAALLARGEGTLAGVRLRRDGLLLREAAAIGPEVPARQGAVWDGRFRLAGPGDPDCRIGALGAEAAGLPRPGWMPAAVARTLPAVRRNMVLVAVPALAYPDPERAQGFRLVLLPPP
ncbi:hypothetical protein ACK8OX_06875, partial [Falsiroseomonas sp. CW058]